MANMPGDGRIELIVKRYPGGRFSGLLDGALSIGDELRFTGPYGALHLRAGDGPVLMVAGGSGMAPVLSLLRQLAAQRSERECASSTARAARDLFYLDLIAELGGRLSRFRFAPVLSHEARGAGSCTRPSASTWPRARYPSRMCTCAARLRWSMPPASC